MYNSPTTPTGCTAPPAPSTYTSTFPIARPIGTFSSAAHSLLPTADTVAHTVASVGPYAFSSRCTAPRHFCATAPLHAAPALTSVASCGTSLTSCTANTDGGSVTTVIPSRCSTAANAVPTCNSSLLPS